MFRHKTAGFVATNMSGKCLQVFFKIYRSIAHMNVETLTLTVVSGLAALIFQVIGLLRLEGLLFLVPPL